jgi:hypothetical protein
VRRWIHRYQRQGTTGLADRPRSGRPRRGSPKLTKRILRLLDQPKAWTIGRLYQRLGRPAISLRTLHRRVREVACWRPRLVAKGDPDRDQIIADLKQQIRDLPTGAVVLAEDETHIKLLPWVRSTWITPGQRQQIMTPGPPAPHHLRRGRPADRPVPVPGDPQGHQRKLHRFLRAPAGCLPSRTSGGGGLRQRDQPPLQDRPAWLKTHPRLRVLHGARYSPHDNPVERIWGTLKAWLANNPTLTIQGRVRQVHAFFRDRTPVQMLATAAPHSSPWIPENYLQHFRQAALAFRQFGSVSARVRSAWACFRSSGVIRRGSAIPLAPSIDSSAPLPGHG